MNRLKTLLANPWLWGAFALCILLLLVGTVMSLVIGRQDLSRVCIICLIVFIAFYAVLLIAGFATIALSGA